MKDSSAKDVYDLIAEFAKASNPSLTQEEIDAEFLASVKKGPMPDEIPPPAETPPSPIAPTSEGNQGLDEIHEKFETLAQQLKETRKQIKKIKQLFNGGMPASFKGNDVDVYHREFHLLSSRLNEVFMTNYKQIEDKFDALQREFQRTNLQKERLQDSTPYSDSFRMQQSMIQGLKEKIEKIQVAFQEKNSHRDHNYITREEFHLELRRFSDQQQNRFQDDLRRSEQHIVEAIKHSTPAPPPPPPTQSAFIQPPPAYPIWLIWVNVFILGLLVMYLFMQLTSRSANNHASINVPQQTHYAAQQEIQSAPPTANEPLTISPKAALHEETPQPINEPSVQKTNPPYNPPKVITPKKNNSIIPAPLQEDSSMQTSSVTNSEDVYFAED